MGNCRIECRKDHLQVVLTEVHLDVCRLESAVVEGEAQQWLNITPYLSEYRCRHVHLQKAVFCLYGPSSPVESVLSVSQGGVHRLKFAVESSTGHSAWDTDGHDP